MARIRTIKPEFWKSEVIARLPKRTRLTFIALWTYVDDNGVGRDVPKLIAAELFPLEEDPREELATVSEDLATLADHGRITRYVVEGKPFLCITNWAEHQKIDKPNRPRYPGPENAKGALTSGSRDPREDVASPSRVVRESPSPGTEEQGNRGTEEEESAPASPRQLSLAPEPEPVRPDVEALCSRLVAAMVSNGCKQPTVTASWRTAARLLLDKDDRPLDDALALIDWSQRHEFWASNIQSLPTFREKYDRLRLQRDGGPISGRPRFGVGYGEADREGPSRAMTGSEWATDTPRSTA